MLQEAFTGHFTDHHAFLLRRMLARVDAINADIAALDAGSKRWPPRSPPRRRRLDEIPGISLTSRSVILAEIGTDMGRFPTAGHLVSWAKFAPGVKESAGKKKGKGMTGHGNSYLARVLGNAAVGAGRATPSSASGTGASPAAAARKAPWSPSAGPSWSSLAPALRPRRALHRPRPRLLPARINPERRKRSHIRQLEALGYNVTLEPAA